LTNSSSCTSDSIEEDAICFCRKGYTSPKENVITTQASNSKSAQSRENKSPGKLKHNFHEAKFFNDDEYMRELLNGENVNEEETEVGKKRLSLRLPKMDAIAPENKAIFYTSLLVTSAFAPDSLSNNFLINPL